MTIPQYEYSTLMFWHLDIFLTYIFVLLSKFSKLCNSRNWKFCLVDRERQDHVCLHFCWCPTESWLVEAKIPGCAYDSMRKIPVNVQWQRTLFWLSTAILSMIIETIININNHDNTGHPPDFWISPDEKYAFFNLALFTLVTEISVTLSWIQWNFTWKLCSWPLISNSFGIYCHSILSSVSALGQFCSKFDGVDTAQYTRFFPACSADGFPQLPW